MSTLLRILRRISGQHARVQVRDGFVSYVWDDPADYDAYMLVYALTIQAHKAEADYFAGRTR